MRAKHPVSCTDVRGQEVKGIFFFGPFGLVLQGQNLSQTRIKKGEGSL